MIAKLAKNLPFAVLGLTLVWYAALSFQYRTHGAIGDDPATYAQMALDLAEHGTVIHEFPLFNNLFDRGLSWDALITPGYHIVRETGIVAPNFAFGFPLLLSLGYRLLGEAAFYRMTPFMGLLSLLLTFALASEFWRELAPARRHWIGAIAALLLATTPKQIQLALVPMSDVPTQLFCLTAMWCALCAFRTSDRTRQWGTVAFVALCGVSFGIAYLIRHSAIILLFPLSITALWNFENPSLRVRRSWFATKQSQFALMGVALLAFMLTILPDLVYRTTILGSPFAVESPESTVLLWLDAPRQIVQTLSALLSVTGLGPILLVLFVLYAVWKQKGERLAIITLTAWILVFILFHAPLRLTGVFENNLRYLLPAYPAVVLLIGRAMVALFAWGMNAVRARRSEGLARFPRTRGGVVVLGGIIVVLLYLLAVRALVSPERFVLRSYGWMSETARADLDALSQSLPQDAVIGVSDQMAGAAMLYVKRDIFRPANFLEPAREFPLFLQEMTKTDRAVYLMGDWNCSPLANTSESLPGWLAEYEMTEPGIEIRDLPYECAQRVREIK